MGPQDPKDLFERRRRKVGDTHRGKESDQRCTRVGLNNQNNVFAVEQRCVNVGSLIKVREVGAGNCLVPIGRTTSRLAYGYRCS